MFVFGSRTGGDGAGVLKPEARTGRARVSDVVRASRMGSQIGRLRHMPVMLHRLVTLVRTSMNAKQSFSPPCFLNTPVKGSLVRIGNAARSSTLMLNAMSLLGDNLCVILTVLAKSPIGQLTV